MRLELESNPSPMPLAERTVAESNNQNESSEAKDALREGIKAAQAGNRAQARTSLLRAASLDPGSESAWLWLASISEYPEELLVFLTNVLNINPHNERALEWTAATKSLMAKTFVQRGIDAVEDKQPDFAIQCFNQALEHDQQNEMAWLWMASLADSNDGKIAYFEQVLSINPDNETAKQGYKAARYEINQNLLAEARAAAVAGRAADADELLNAIIAENPDSEDAWILRSHLANSFDDKIKAFERVLEINAENAVARAGLDSLRSIMQTVAPKADPQAADSNSHVSAALEAERTRDSEPVIEKSPTQELEWPSHMSVAETTETSPAASIDEPEETVYFEEPADDIHATSAVGHETDEPVSIAETPDSFEEMPAYQSEVESADYDVRPTGLYNFANDDHLIYQSNESEASASADSAASRNPFDSFASEASEMNEAPAESESENIFEHVAEEHASGPAAEENGIGAYSFSRDDLAIRSAFDSDESSLPPFEESIPMPSMDFTNLEEVGTTGFETTIERQDNGNNNAASLSRCPFCESENEAQAFVCQSCNAMLTLSDLEGLLANTNADKYILRLAVERMESERSSREFGENELTMLGIGHLNLRNLQFGYNYLLEASQLNPNNIVLSSQVNALHIRLNEIRDQEEANEAMPKGKRILVVDDSPTVRKLIAGKLEKSGHDVFCSSDGVEAMERLAEFTPDLILLDINMPRMDGYQVCKLIRGNPQTKDVPVVMISGKDGFFDKVRGRMAGTTGYITKPFGPETLMKAVETYLSGEVEAVV